MGHPVQYLYHSYIWCIPVTTVSAIMPAQNIALIVEYQIPISKIPDIKRGADFETEAGERITTKKARLASDVLQVLNRLE